MNTILVDSFYEYCRKNNVYFNKRFINTFLSDVKEPNKLNSNNFENLLSDIIKFSKKYEINEIIEVYSINFLESPSFTLNKQILAEIVSMEDVGNCKFREKEDKDFDFVKLDGFDILDEEDNSNSNTKYNKYSTDKCLFQLKLKLFEGVFVHALEKDQFIFLDILKNNNFDKNIKIVLLPGIKVISGVFLLKKNLINIII